VRVTVEVPAGLVLADGTPVQGVTTDLSSGGVRLRPNMRVTVKAGDAVSVVFPLLDGDAALPATVIGVEDETVRARFCELTLEQEEALTMVLYSRADSWLGWDQERESDRPLVSILRILRLSARGLRQAIAPRRQAFVTSVVPALLLAVAMGTMGLLTLSGCARVAHASAMRTMVLSDGVPVAAAASPVTKAPAPAVSLQPAAAGVVMAVAPAVAWRYAGWRHAFEQGRAAVLWKTASVMAAEFPWMLAVVVLVVSFLLAVLLAASLRRRARRRLLAEI
jgi:hypothetical protein